MNETQLQRDAMAWIWTQRGPNGLWLAWHTPNEGYRTPREAAIQKAKGVVAGVPDIIIHEPYNNLCGVAIELKRPGGRLTKAQEIILRAISDRCYHVGVAESLLEVKMICQDLVNWCKTNNQ